jgi:hypothetical protein
MGERIEFETNNKNEIAAKRKTHMKHYISLFKSVLAAIGIVCMTSGCALNIGMVQPSVSIHGIGSHNEPLQVDIDESIKSDFDVQTTELKTAHFKDYRKSLEQGFNSAFSGVFQGVNFVNTIPNSGWVIHLEKADPKHVVTNQHEDHRLQYNPGFQTDKGYVPGYAYETSQTVSEIAFSVSWYAVLYKNGKEVCVSEGKLLSEDRAQSVGDAPKVLKNALELMMEKIGTDLFRTQTASTTR